MFLNISYQDKFIEQFLSSGIVKFYSNLDELLKLFDLTDLFHRAGEKTFTDIFDKGLWHLHGRDKLISLQQLSVKKDENRYGLPDLLVKYNNDTLLLFECKWHPSDEKDPKSPRWKHEETQKYYAYILNQANEYLNEKDFYSGYSNKYIIGLVFTTVEFSTEEFIKDWHYNDLDPNEFYSFNNYSHKGKMYGIAVYGIVEFKLLRQSQ